MFAYCPTDVTEMQSYRYGSQTISRNMYTRGEELHYCAWCHFLPIPLVVASSLTHSFPQLHTWSFTSWSWHSDNEFSNITFSFSEHYISSLQIPQQCHAFHDICASIRVGNYYWWIKCWWFCPIIANRQSLLHANISSYMVCWFASYRHKLMLQTKYSLCRDIQHDVTYRIAGFYHEH